MPNKCHSVGASRQLTHTVVTLAAVRGARRPEHLTGEAVLELDDLLVDEDLFNPRWGPVAGVSGLI